jgi:hypothetical protein
MAITVSTPKTSISGTPIVADVAELRALARDLARVAPEAAKGLQKGMASAGQVIAANAKQRASYSKRIPGSIKVRVARGNVKVSAGGEAAPNAAPIENRGKGFIRHPIYLTYDQAHSGDDAYKGRWTEKNSHPAFLAPALDATAVEVAELIADAQLEAVQRAIGG